MTRSTLLAAAVLAVIVTVPGRAASPSATFVVTNTEDSGEGSLRAAITAANANPGADTIVFAIPGAGPHTITISSSPLPAITDPVAIDGRTEPDFDGTPSVHIDAAIGGAGFDVEAGSSTLRGLSITGFEHGVQLRSDGENRLAGNWIGLTPAGEADGNQVGVRIDGTSHTNLIGGRMHAERNVISGNTGPGILISASSANLIVGNYIGTNPAADARLPNHGTGVEISAGATANRVGGLVAPERNVISGNWASGITFSGVDTSSNLVQGNYIGSDAAGLAALGNGNGVLLHGGATNNTVGGSTTGARNIISGNGSTGVHLEGTGTSDNRIEGNYVGTDVTGTAPLRNNVGVRIWDGADRNKVGGNAIGAGNVISGNDDEGVTITGNQNVVTGNYVGIDATGRMGLPNRGPGISLYGSGNIIGGISTDSRNVISGNDYSGLYIAGSQASANLVQGNYIGTDITGSEAIRNGIFGIRLESGANGNTIGGAFSRARNVISGNNSGGVWITGRETARNEIQGNYIGTDATGESDLPNSYWGIAIFDGPTENTIGGPEEGAGNVISGNPGPGVYIDNAWANNFQGNRIGTNARGTAAVPNGGHGIEVADGFDNTFGGSSVGAGNVISGNAEFGVFLWDTNGDVFEGNYIGTDARGRSAVPNRQGGISLGASGLIRIGGPEPGLRNIISGNLGPGIVTRTAGLFAIQGNFIGVDVGGTRALGNASDGVMMLNGTIETLVGGTTNGAGNIIAFNAGAGVSVEGPASGEDSILRNSIHSNGGAGIRLINGGNNNQPAPTISSVERSGRRSVVKGALHGSAESTWHRIEIFVSPMCDESGAGEGMNFYKSATVLTDFNGSATFSVRGARLPPNEAVTATATNLATGDTSEFSLCVIS